MHLRNEVYNPSDQDLHYPLSEILEEKNEDSYFRLWNSGSSVSLIYGLHKELLLKVLKLYVVA